MSGWKMYLRKKMHACMVLQVSVSLRIKESMMEFSSHYLASVLPTLFACNAGIIGD